MLDQTLGIEGQGIPADFVAGEVSTIQRQNVYAASRQTHSAGGSCRTQSHNQHLDLQRSFVQGWFC